MPSIEEDGKDVDVDNVTRPFDFALRLKDNGSRTVIKEKRKTLFVGKSVLS